MAPAAMPKGLARTTPGAFISGVACRWQRAGGRRMTDKIHPVPADFARKALVNHAKYLDMYKRSVVDPDAFWGEQARRIDWTKPFTRVKNTSFDLPNVSIKWFEDGELNVSTNCLDRHLATRGDQT